MMAALVERIDAIPAGLADGSRTLVDCIDVEDMLGGISETGGRSSDSLQASLFLFSDALLIVKRAHGVESGRRAAGLDDIDGLVSQSRRSQARRGQLAPSRSFGSPSKPSSSRPMSFRGLVELGTVTAADHGPDGFELFLSSPPQGVSERWAGRTLRRFVGTERDQARFLDSFWRAQMAAQARDGTVVVQSGLGELARHGGCNVLPGDAHVSVSFAISDRSAYDPRSHKVCRSLHLLG